MSVESELAANHRRAPEMTEADLTPDRLRKMLRQYIRARHPSAGPYHDIMDALVVESGPRKREAVKRCVELYNALMGDRQ